MKRKTVGFLALLFSLMWVLATAVPSEAGRYYRGYNGHRHFHHRPFVGAYYSSPYYYRPYYYSPYYYRPYYGRAYGYYPYPYYGSSISLGWPFFWPGLSFNFRF